MPSSRVVMPLIIAFAVAVPFCPNRGLAADKSDVKEPAKVLPDYSTAFDAALREIGAITPEQFAKRFALKGEYLPKLSWDPTTAKHWTDFNLDPQKFVSKGQRHPLGQSYDFRMNEQESALFKQNGFMVSERLGDPSPSQVFYRIYTRDLPVYISADAVLHAWHRSYDAMLEEIEAANLSPALAEILRLMTDSLPTARREYGDGVLGASLADVDFFLTVARSLLAGKTAGSMLNQDHRVAEALKACAEEKLLEFDLFGRDRHVDFSQFKPRGHYENRPELQKYFRAMMWCGRIDLRVAGNPKLASPRELGAAIVLNDLLRRAGQYEPWRQFDRLLQTFVGRADSMTFAHLGEVLAEAKVGAPADIKDMDALTKIQNAILTGKLGKQHVRGDVYFSPADSRKKLQMPRSFTMIGQRFAVDSWALSKVVYDDILWNDVKVNRRIPSGLDIVFAALGNDQATPELAARMTDAKGRQFRDGLNYQHNLAAARQVIDGLKPTDWEESIYTGWLDCLRRLSAPTTDAKYPEAMRTRAWAQRMMNTQLASWTQLRHDTILYVKQSYTGVPLCSYPAGFVEPMPEFWERVEKMATRAAELIEATPWPDYTLEREEPAGTKDGRQIFRTVIDKHNGKQTREKQAAFLRNFAKQVAVLREIARKELAQIELTAEEAKFLDETVQLAKHGSGRALHGGWYPGLFYRGREDALTQDALVADVHTDPPSELDGDPGCVLHQGVGHFDLLVIAVDSGKDRMVYAGPVLSHYEFEMPGVQRQADSQWQGRVKSGPPARPDWTRSYLAPRGR